MATFPITVAAPPAAFENLFNGGSVQNPGTIGPFGHNGSAYLFLTNTQTGLDPGNVVCYKSSGADYGTWAEADAANAPVVPASGGGFTYKPYAAVRDPSLPVVYVIYWGNDTFLHMKPFNMDTNTWGADVGSALGYGPSNNFGSSNNLSLIPVATHRGSDNSLWVSIVRPLPSGNGGTRAYAAKLLLDTDTWDANWTLLGTVDAVSIDSWWPLGMRTDSSGRIQVILEQRCAGFDCLVGPGLFSRLYSQAIKTDNTLAAAVTIFDSGVGSSLTPVLVSYLSIGEDDGMIFTYHMSGIVPQPLHVVRGTSSDSPVWSDEEPPELQSPKVATAALRLNGLDYVFYAAAGPAPGSSFFYSTSSGAGWEDPGTHIGDDPGTGGTFANGLLVALSFNPIGITGFLTDSGGDLGQWFWAIGAAPPVPTVRRRVGGGGGTYFPRYLNRTLLSASMARTQVPAPLSYWFEPPNQYSGCLATEFVLFKGIDRSLLGCRKRPECFTGVDERDWQDPPHGSVTFNPPGSIPLPAAAAGDVVVLSFYVPFGFDGIVTAQFHGYTQPFLEGSGDLVWRVRANGRYLRDMGEMLSSIGSVQHLNPCPGGLWVHSGNLVEYVVAAPNTNGSLPPPGVGFILASLHGWFFPRK